MTSVDLQRVARSIAPGARLLRTWPLKGGISSQMSAFEFALPGGAAQRCVLRVPSDWSVAHNPRAADDEYRLLLLLHGRGVPVPEPLLLGRDPAYPDRAFLVLKYVDGEPGVDPCEPIDCAQQMAAALAGLHRMDGESIDISFLPEHAPFLEKQLAEPPARLDDSLAEGIIRDALCMHLPAALERSGLSSPTSGLTPARSATVGGRTSDRAAAQSQTLLHGDFWPGNVLWRDERIVAVIDWEDSARGDPLMDVGISRLDLLWAYGEEAMAAFTERYASLTGRDLADLAVWDLCAALRPMGVLDAWAAGGLEFQGRAASAVTMRAQHRLFVDGALQRLQ